MIMIPDRTGRFPERPHYHIDELEADSENLITDFLMRRYGQLVIPVPTPALVALLERDAQAIDLYCDLTAEGEEIHGLTEFFPGSKPRVSVARELSFQHWRAHRLRSTLTHEYGHVHWHASLYDRYCGHGERHKCARGNVLPQKSDCDWMEWQAGYVSGVLLMPKSRVALYVTAFHAERAIEGPLDPKSIEGRVLITRTAELFNVSEEAAEVRLGQLGYLRS
jgi:hypothetical protein